MVGILTWLSTGLFPAIGGNCPWQLEEGTGAMQPFYKRAGRDAAPKKAKNQQLTNYRCILLEGLFNTLGTDILGISTIVPLFLAEFGASLTLIGSLSTMHQAVSALVPLLSGGFIAAAASKKRLSITLNGISRTAILLVPLFLILRLPDPWIVAGFFAIILVYFVFQSMTGIIWNHLLGDCVEGRRRGQLVGTLFAISGFITFASSSLVKIIRDSAALNRWEKYAIIFGLAGVLVAVSVLCFIPLKEQGQAAEKQPRLPAREYLRQLLRCFQNRDYDKMLAANCFSQASIMINSFIYLFAQDFLKLSTSQVSSLLVLQTLGVVAGGFLTGRISSRFGSKRMITLVESLGVLVPLLNLAAMRISIPFPVMGAAVFLMGFSRSGYMGYQTHLLEVAEPERKIYYIVCKSLVLLPVSLVSTLVGHFLQQMAGGSVFALQPVYGLQILLALCAAAAASRLRLVVYEKRNKGPKAS